jgi:quercetin dioxygenase-like cupin family protein
MVSATKANRELTKRSRRPASQPLTLRDVNTLHSLILDESNRDLSVKRRLRCIVTHGGILMRIRAALLLSMSLIVVLLVAQSRQEPTIRGAQQNVFHTSPVLPDCYTYAVERGDPETGPSVTLSKLASGCKVPWHIHSANAQVLFVRGSFQLMMKGQPAQILSQGAYAYIPAEHKHQETCLDGCMYYVIREGAG